MKRSTILCFIFLICSVSSSIDLTAQCNVDVTKFEGLTMHRFALEQMSDMISYENGALSAFLEIDAVHDSLGKKNIVTMQIYIGNIPYENIFAPREVIINFIDSSFVIKAIDYQHHGDSIVHLVSYRYVLSTDLIIKLAREKVISLDFVDTRLKSKVSFNPYDGIFKTQMRCISQSIIDNTLTSAIVKIDTNSVEGFTGLVTDIDGNVYHTITIGKQVWMAENLKTTKYNDGTSISNITDNIAWSALTSGAYCWFNNDIAYNDLGGALYNWYAVNAGKLAPKGWHVPTQAELNTLRDFLGGIDIAGGKLKEIGTALWYSPNKGATNEFGFAAIPSGYRDINGEFYGGGKSCWLWSSSEGRSPYAWCWNMSNTGTLLGGVTNEKEYGYSVRCIKDY